MSHGGWLVPWRYKLARRVDSPELESAAVLSLVMKVLDLAAQHSLQALKLLGVRIAGRPPARRPVKMGWPDAHEGSMVPLRRMRMKKCKIGGCDCSTDGFDRGKGTHSGRPA